MRLSALLFASAVLAAALPAPAEPAANPPATDAAEGPYKVLKAAKVGGAGGFDYVYADSEGRRLYVPRGNRVMVYNLDTLEQAGEIPDTKGVHGVATDPKSGHGFSSSNPVVMFDTKTLATIKTIPVEGNPDGIFFEPATQRVYVLSHRAPNVTVLDAADGSVAGTIDLGGAPEQGASDGKGRVYIDVEDKDNVAVVDAKAMKVTAHYDLGGKGEGPPAWRWTPRTTSCSPSAADRRPPSCSTPTTARSSPPSRSAAAWTPARSTPPRWRRSARSATGR